jgi:hypothetical protein
MPRTATASAASAPARLAASTSRSASELSADWSNRPEFAASGESGDTADDEEFTNKIPGVEGTGAGAAANQGTVQMCPIHGEFKHFPAPKAKDFRFARNDSSIMSAKLLSIMPMIARQVTPD